MKQRVTWIDVCKGIAILLVILGHTTIPPRTYNYIYSFHMPLFFMLSGYLFSMSRHSEFMPFLKSRVKSLVIPYFSFGIISIIAIDLASVVDPAKYGHTLSGQLTQLVLSRRDQIGFNIPLWFLTCLFVIEIVYYVLRRYIKNDLLLLAVLLLVGFYGFKTQNSPWVWSANVALYFMLFYGVGNIVRERSITLHKSTWFSLVAVSVATNVSIFVFPSLIQFGSTYLAHYIVANLAAAAGIITAVSISKLVGSSRVFTYLGRNTLPIFGLHGCVGFLIAGKLLSTLHIHPPTAYDLFGLTVMITTLLVVIPGVVVINRYFPFILGKPIRLKSA
ncbi:acyltransferase family protein [Alicyclobacillus sp. SO9]|uniref:acyltransferase family protein n=1 Tax=Alicyclobacillus sp. SO9 TaxID=2665646 RepID=UPI0018E6F512|nr:acyltransferase family protein [Alicyclobacillus sp. SO9]QQE80941.1 acyltransferase family protein [Alicyclobacillus sp. SO9]